MDLKTYLAILNRYRIVILGTLLFALIAAGAGTFLLTPQYEAAATVRFATAINGSTEWVQYNIEYTDRLMTTYSQLATSTSTKSELIRQFKLNSSPEINVNILANSELMRLSVTNPSGELAAQMANSLAQFLIRQGAQVTDSNRKRAQALILQQITQAEVAINLTQASIDAVIGDDAKAIEARNALQRTLGAQKLQLDQIRKEYDQAQLQERLQSMSISVVDPAVTPTSQSSPNLLLNLALGFVAGLAGGLGMAFLLFHFDTNVRSIDQLKLLSDLPVLGEIPDSHNSTATANVDREADPAGYDAFRRLSINIISRANKQSFSSFLISSSQEQEGRSTIVANLAWAFAESGRRVIVVDSDFRSPTAHILFGLPNHVGLSNILQEQEWLYKQRQQVANPISMVNGMGNGIGNGTGNGFVNNMPSNPAAMNGMAMNSMAMPNGMPTPNGTAIYPGVSTANGASIDPSYSQGVGVMSGSFGSSAMAEAADLGTLLNKSFEMVIANSVQRSMIPGVQVLTTGPITLNNPAQLLSPFRVSALFQQLQERCDVVLIDAPANASAAYTSTLASVVDAVIFVVGYGRVKQDSIKDNLNQLRAVNPNVIGVVANWARAKK